jgi:hypothetical protein
MIIWEVGEQAIFDNGNTEPETIIIEDITNEWDKGKKVPMATFSGTKYALEHLKPKDWEACFRLVQMKVKRLVKGYKPPAAVVNGEQLWGELKSLQDDMDVLSGGQKYSSEKK